MQYEELVREINRREVVRKRNLQNSKIVEMVADFVSKAPDIGEKVKKGDFLVLDITDRMVEDLAHYMLQDKGEDSPRTELTPEGLLTSEFLVDRITPWVEHVRERLFGSTEAPYSNFEDAIKWLRDALKRAMEEAEKVPQPEYPWLEYLLRGQYWEDTPEIVFMNEAHEVAKATGFSYNSMVMYVLTGTEPVLPGFELQTKVEEHRLPLGEDLINRFATVTIRGGLSWEDLQSLYRRTRDQLRIKRTKPLNEKHLELYRLVSSKGGPVRGKGSVAFWELINRDWQNDECRTWEGARRAYDRLEKRLSNWYLSKKPKKGAKDEAEISKAVG